MILDRTLFSWFWFWTREHVDKDQNQDNENVSLGMDLKIKTIKICSYTHFFMNESIFLGSWSCCGLSKMWTNTEIVKIWTKAIFSCDVLTFDSTLSWPRLQHYVVVLKYKMN